MKIKVNGQIKELHLKRETPTLDAVISQLGYQPQLIVIEFNGIILEPSKWSKQEVKTGDSLEIVTIVGGGS